MKLDLDFHFLSSAYGDSVDEPNDMQFEEFHPEHQEISQEIPDPVIPVPPRPRHCASSPFNMVAFMHKTLSYKLNQVFRAADDMPSIPLHVPCDRAGGGARRAILKANYILLTILTVLSKEINEPGNLLPTAIDAQ
jgi:hypothetical protein